MSPLPESGVSTSQATCVLVHALALDTCLYFHLEFSASVPTVVQNLGHPHVF